jgi:endonuclease-3 related protein
VRQAGFRIRTTYQALLAAYGPQGWWPGDGAFETVVGAILTQNTSWKNVEHALANLGDRGALADPEALGSLSGEELERSIRPAGFPRRKAVALRGFLALAGREAGGLPALLARPGADLRGALLGVKGIGPETADSILLYAAGRPVFVVDAYTRRFAGRHGIVGDGSSYGDVQKLFEAALPRSASVMNEYHALIVRLGKTHCRPTPRCGDCPLRWDLTMSSRARGRGHRHPSS